MRLLKWVISLFCMIQAFYLNTEQIDSFDLNAQEQINPFVLITIPKSGSHLTMKALHFMTGGVSLWHTRFPSLFCVPPRDGFLYTHFCLSPQLEKDYSHLPSLKKIINVRDLRDVSISMIRQIYKHYWPGMTEEQRDAFKQWSFDDQLLFVINYDYEVEKSAPNALQVSLPKIVEQVLRYCADRNNLICKYENLVGPEGGGTESAQVEELQRIAKYLNIPDVSAEGLQEIASQLYGNKSDPFGKEGFENFESTFYQGCVGRWKTAFKEEHKAAFKEKFGQALIALGYEQDLNW